MIAPREDIEFQQKLEHLLNYYGIDTYCDIPDYIIMDHLIDTIENMRKTHIKINGHNNTLKEVEKIDHSSIKITQENFKVLQEQGKIKEHQVYKIVENPDEENYVEL